MDRHTESALRFLPVTLSPGDSGWPLTFAGTPKQTTFLLPLILIPALTLTSNGLCFPLSVSSNTPDDCSVEMMVWASRADFVFCRCWSCCRGIVAEAVVDVELDDWGRREVSEPEGDEAVFNIEEGEGGMTTVFASPSTLIEAPILIFMGASWVSGPSSDPSSKVPKVSSLMGMADALEV